MNSQANSTGLPGFAMPRGNLTAQVDIDRIVQMSAYEIWSLQGSIHTLGDVIAGMLCQPKHFGSNDAYNLAGDCLEGIAAWLSTYEQAVVNMAEATSAIVSAKARRSWVAAVQPEPGVSASEVIELLQRLDQLPPDRRQWFVDQMRRLDRGEPNVIDGTAPNPYAEGEPDAQ